MACTRARKGKKSGDKPYGRRRGLASNTPSLTHHTLFSAGAHRRFYGDTKAKQLKVDLLKLILKIVLLYRNKVITADQAAPARPKILNLMDEVIDTLEATSTERVWQSAADRMISDLVAVAKEAHDAVMPLLQPNVREHNWRRLTHVFDSFGSPAFLAAFLGDPAYRADRESVLANFKALARPYETEMTEMKKFGISQILDRRAKMERMTTGPTLRMWLDDGRGADLFQEWLRSRESASGAADGTGSKEAGSGGLNLVMFIRSVDYFRGTNNRGLLRQRAEQVVETYLLGPGKCKCAITVRDEAAREDAVAKVQDGRSTGRSVFDVVEDDVTAQLNAIFRSHFLKSTQFNSLVDEIRDIDVRLSRQEHMTELVSGGGGGGGGGAAAAAASGSAGADGGSSLSSAGLMDLAVVDTAGGEVLLGDADGDSGDDADVLG